VNKLKVESLKVNILSALQLKTAKSNNKYNKSEIYIQDPDEMIQNFEDIQNLKESKQNKLKAGNSISINSNNEISAEVDLSPYYTKTQTAKLFMGRDETYTKEEIDERTGINGIIAGDNISISNESGRPKIATTIAYKLRDKAMSIGNSILGRGTSVGVNASATGDNSVALGADSVAALANQISVGNTEVKRIISNVADGVEANDVVTVGQLNKKLSSALDQLNRLAGQLYPVGSIYMNINNVDPAAIFGGTWERMPAGRMLVNSGDGFNLNEVGGEKEHRLTEDELASHNHGAGEMAGGHTHTRGTMDITGDFVGALQSNFDYGVHGAFYHERHETIGPAGNKGDPRQRVWFKASKSWTGETSESGAHTHNFLPSGKNQPHNNMPPYIVVNMWKRIS
jgi:microcystin-dependent protein